MLFKAAVVGFGMRKEVIYWQSRWISFSLSPSSKGDIEASSVYWKVQPAVIGARVSMRFYSAAGATKAMSLQTRVFLLYSS
jgi:hypothetical protein